MALHAPRSYFNADGRIRGSYVYMLLCSEDSSDIHVKIGVSDNPEQRLTSLRKSCPARPVRFATVHVHARPAALRLERDLIENLARWSAGGEWLRLSIKDKPEFNQLLVQSLGRHATPSWPLRWVQFPVKPLADLKRQRQKSFQRKAMERGRAFRDAHADSKKR